MYIYNKGDMAKGNGCRPMEICRGSVDPQKRELQGDRTI